MAGIKFGPVYTAMEEFMGPVELAEKAEAWGYDSFWVPDVLLTPRMESMTALAAAAQKTTRIKLGTGVLVLPSRHPVQLAKTALSLDVLSQGRLLLGVGIGADPKEFEAMGVDLHQRGRISDESLQILKRLFTETNVTHQGKFHQFRDVTLSPRGMQRPHIPIWVGATWSGQFPEGVIRRTARFADAFLPVDAPVQAYRKAQERIAQQAEAYGRDPSSIEWASFLWICLGDNPEEARQKATRVLGQRIGRREVEFGRGAALGTPQDCIETIEEYAALGITHFVLDGACLPSEMAQQYEQIACEVLPHFRKRPG